VAVDEFLCEDEREAFLRRERAEARKLRRSVWWRRRLAEGRCHYCGQQVGARALTMDHLVPLSRGGRSTRGNLVPCCGPCNTQKRSLTPVELILRAQEQAGGGSSED